MRINLPFSLLIVFCLACTLVSVQTSIFTYQGRLTDGTAAANGTYQMTFTLFDVQTGGTLQGSTITNNSVSVVNGTFTVQLDFLVSPWLSGADRFLEIA